MKIYKITEASDTVKNCPFCGEAGSMMAIQTGTPDREGTPTCIMCIECGATGPWIYLQQELAVEGVAQISGWNERAQ